MKIPITKPCFDQTEFELIRKPLESGWLVQGPFVKEFERLFAAFTGAPFAKASSSCTTALHLALAALGIGEGDRVLVPPSPTWPAPTLWNTPAPGWPSATST